MAKFRTLEGLPPYGPLATSFPDEWGHFGREGFVVEFTTASGRWVANFKPGGWGVTLVLSHPNNRDVIVITKGDLWIVDPESRDAKFFLPAIEEIMEVTGPKGRDLLLNRQGLAWARLGHDGLVWHTRRLSWDGFDDLSIVEQELLGVAWSPVDERFYPFRIDLRTGRSWGGSYSVNDSEGWEKLAK